MFVVITIIVVIVTVVVSVGVMVVVVVAVIVVVIAVIVVVIVVVILKYYCFLIRIMVVNGWMAEIWWVSFLPTVPHFGSVFQKMYFRSKGGRPPFRAAPIFARRYCISAMSPRVAVSKLQPLSHSGRVRLRLLPILQYCVAI